MEIYCVSCQKYTENKNLNVTKIKKKKNRLMLLSNCTVCGKKKSTSTKNKELHNFGWFKMNKNHSQIFIDQWQIYAWAAFETARVY